MKILRRHIASTLLRSILLVGLVLLALDAFIIFSDQFDNLGEGDFNLWQAAIYTLMVLPQQFYAFVPIVILLGSLMGLGQLASQSELIVMRAAGVSVGRIAWWQVRGLWLLILVIVLLGETLAPIAQNKANMRRTELRSGGQMVQTQRGIWLRDKNEYVHIERARPGENLQGITRYQFNQYHRLDKVSYAKTAKRSGHHWLLQDIKTTLFLPDRVTSETRDKEEWRVRFSPEVLSSAMLEPDAMTIVQLWRYIRESKRNGMQVAQHEFWFWQRLFQPFTLAVMLLLATPFIFGPLRSSSMGLRVVSGLLLGFLFYLLNQFLGPFSVVYQWPAAFIAALPTVLFGLIGIVVVKRL